MRIRNISLRVVSLLVLTFVFVVATAVFTLFDIRMQTQNMEDSLAEEARTFAREMDAVWEFMDNSQHTINNTTTGVYEFKGLHCAIVGKSVGAIFSAGNNYSIRYTNFEPRRAQDKPDAFETEALALFNEQKDTQEFFRIVSDDPAEVDRAQTSADNGAAQMARMLIEDCTDLTMFIGKAINPAHQNPNLPMDLSIKMRLLNELADVMRKMGRRVEVNFY